MPSSKPTIQDLPDDPGPDEPESSLPGHTDHDDPIQVAVISHIEPTDTQLTDWLETQARRAVELCEINQAQLTIVIVADEEMAQLHEQYTGIPGTTDVLTFDMTQGGSPPVSQPIELNIEGDIIVCLDEAKRQANERDHDAQHELLLYAVHGLMHLLGEDDHEEEDYNRMHAREDALLKQMGFGPLFNSSPQPPDPRP